MVSANTPKANKVGTVGRPIADVQVTHRGGRRNSSEGPCVMQGYYRKPDETRAAFTPDGWLLTGDIGRLDEDGYLIITDRKKELLKTAGGKFVAPAPIENMLKTSPLHLERDGRGRQAQIRLRADRARISRRIEAAARKAGREFSTPAQMLADPWVRDLLHAGDRAADRASRAVRKAEAFRAARKGFHATRAAN